MHVAVAFAVTGAVCVALEQSLRKLAGWRVVSSIVSRRLTHALMGPVFILCWPLFSKSFSSPGNDGYFTFVPSPWWYGLIAAMIPLAITIKFAAIGLGVFDDPYTRRMLCRNGNCGEILYGPVQYGIVFTVATALFFQSALAITCLMNLCIGDVAAAVIGSQFGNTRWPIPNNNTKTILGTIAFVLTSGPASLLVIQIVNRFLPYMHPLPSLSCVMMTALVGALVEAMTPSKFDNVTVFLATLLSYVICVYPIS